MKNTYLQVIKDIKQKFEETILNESLSFETKNFVDKTLKVINESATPMMEIRRFYNNAENISDKSTLSELMKFITKHTKSGNLNYIINLAKEEHIEKLRLSKHPLPEQTLKDIDFSENDNNVIISNLKKGLYDSIESDIIDELKERFLTDSFKKSRNIITKDANDITLNESSLQFYSPIGIRYEDVTNNRLILLTESLLLSYNRDNDKYGILHIEDVTIPQNHLKLVDAINQLNYDLEDNSFSPAMHWDFNAVVDSFGDIVVWKDVNNKKKIDYNTFRELFKESLINSKNSPNYEMLVRDADNMCMICENFGKLTKIDTLKVVRNLSENSKYIIKTIFDNPTIICGVKNGVIEGEQKFIGYSQLNESLSKSLNTDTTKLFENQISKEIIFEKDKQSGIDKLYEKQKEIEKDLKNTKNLLSVAEPDSEAFKSLNESIEMLETKLTTNINDIKEIKFTTLYGEKI